MRYQVGCSLRTNDPTYVVREADEKLYVEVKAGNFCYVFNSRQTGKSSLLQRTSHRLEQEAMRVFTWMYPGWAARKLRLCNEGHHYQPAA